MRLTPVRAVAVALAAVLAGAVTGLTTRPDRSTSSLRSYDPPPVVTEPAVETATPSAGPTASPTPEPASTSPAATTTPPPEISLPVPTASPTTAEPVAEPDVVLDLSRDRVATATKLVLTAHWRVAQDVFVRVHLGDGHPPLEAGGWCGAPLHDATRTGDWYEATFPWSYRTAGTYQVYAETLHYPCQGGSIERVGRTVAHPVVVTQGAVAGNGPWQPVVRLGFQDSTQANLTEPNPDTYLLWVTARDADGWMRGIRIDWHDGTAPEENVLFLEDCVSTGYPDTTFPWGGNGGTSSLHTVPGPGTYLVTVTAWSATCTGDEVQTTTTTGTLVVP